MKPFLFFLSVLFSTFSFSQDKVKWNVSYDAKKQEIQFTANIADGWHLYSQHIKNDIGPVPTAFVYTETAKVKFDGAVSEPKPISEYDANFEASLDFFKREVVFTQKVAKGSSGTVKGYVTYMVCNDTQCLPPVDFDFSVIIK